MHIQPKSSNFGILTVWSCVATYNSAAQLYVAFAEYKTTCQCWSISKCNFRKKEIVHVVKAPAGRYLCSLAHNEPCRWRKRQLTFQTEFDLYMDHLFFASV